MSEPNKIRKWVVEKFDGIGPGLLFMVLLPCDEKSFSKRKSSMFMNSADMNSALAALAPEALGSACCL